MKNRFENVEGIEELVGQTIGAASMCWEDVCAAGVFNATEAREILHETLARLSQFMGEPQPSERPKGAFIEIVEKVKPGDVDGATIFPTEIRINGTPVLVPAGEAVIVHEMSVPSDDLVKVTMTVFARRVSMFQEEQPAEVKP